MIDADKMNLSIVPNTISLQSQNKVAMFTAKEYESLKLGLLIGVTLIFIYAITTALNKKSTDENSS